MEEDLYSDPPVHMPVETIGVCNKCKEIAELGDGFCLKCWDKGAGNRKAVYPYIRYKRVEK